MIKSLELKKKSFLKKFEEITENFCHKTDAYVSEPSDENIHDIRVAIRRLESAHRIFPKTVKTRTGIRNYVKNAKMLFKLNAEIRDFDIICARLETKYQNKTHDLVEALKNQRKGRLEEANKIALKLSNLRPPKISETILKESKFKRRYKKIINEIVLNIQKNFIISLRDERKIEELHMLRKDFKKLRYSLELASNTKTTSFLVKSLKSIQNILGEIHDSDIIIEYLKNVEQNSEFLDIVESEVLERRKKYRAFIAFFKRRKSVLRNLGL